MHLRVKLKREWRGDPIAVTGGLEIQGARAQGIEARNFITLAG